MKHFLFQSPRLKINVEVCADTVKFKTSMVIGAFINFTNLYYSLAEGATSNFNEPTYVYRLTWYRYYSAGLFMSLWKVATFSLSRIYELNFTVCLGAFSLTLTENFLNFFLSVRDKICAQTQLKSFDSASSSGLKHFHEKRPSVIITLNARSFIDFSADSCLKRRSAFSVIFPIQAAMKIKFQTLCSQSKILHLHTLFAHFEAQCWLMFAFVELPSGASSHKKKLLCSLRGGSLCSLVTTMNKKWFCCRKGSQTIISTA